MMAKEGRLTRVGVLAPAALSACIDASVLAAPAASAIVSTVLKELSKAFMLKKWFYGSISAKEAEQLMMEKGKNGSFLVRESRGHPGDYALTVRAKRRVCHVIIRKQDDKFDVGSGEQFDDLIGLIEHFRSFPIVETSGEILRLIQPLSGSFKRNGSLEEKDSDVHVLTRSSIERYHIQREFLALKALGNTKGYTFVEASKLRNEGRNRYHNIKPYDQTRVVLRRMGRDYINASRIEPAPIVEGNDREFGTIPLNKSYIATQGCLEKTVQDFWQMVLQEDVLVIVMILTPSECESGKCAKYWPDFRLNKEYAGHTIESTFENTIGHTSYRIFDIFDKDKKYIKTIFHYQFKVWPDNGVPHSVMPVLDLVTTVNSRVTHLTRNNPDRKNVMCVHCSAGVGRTGAFIVIDMIIDQINAAGKSSKIDVYSTLELVRNQRPGMVQNENQYLFIHDVVREFLSGII